MSAIDWLEGQNTCKDNVSMMEELVPERLVECMQLFRRRAYDEQKRYEFCNEKIVYIVLQEDGSESERLLNRTQSTLELHTELLM